MPESCALYGSMGMMTMNSHINRRLVLLNMYGPQNTAADLRAWIRWLDPQFGKAKKIKIAYMSGFMKIVLKNCTPHTLISP